MLISFLKTKISKKKEKKFFIYYLAGYPAKFIWSGLPRARQARMRNGAVLPTNSYMNPPKGGPEIYSVTHYYALLRIITHYYALFRT